MNSDPHKIHCFMCDLRRAWRNLKHGKVAVPLLLPIMFGAFFMDTIPTVREKKQPKELSQWVSNLLCTPEAQLIVILLSLTLL